MLSLQVLFLLFCLLLWLEEPLQSRLLGGLDILLQPTRGTPYTIFAEPLFLDEEFD